MSLSARRGRVLPDVLDARGAGDRQHHRRARAAARPAPAGRAGPRLLGDPLERRRPAPASLPVASGNQGMNAMPWASAVLEQLLRRAVGEVVEVLDRDDPGDLLGLPRAGSTVTSDRPMWRILPSSWSQLEHADLLLERDLGVDPVQLEQLDALQPEVAQAHLRHCWRRYSGRPTGRHSPRARCG